MPSAVIVIDVQAGLCAGEHAAFDSAGVIDRINTVTRKARSAGVPVVFVQHESDDGVLRAGSPGWQLASGLQRAPGDHLVRKRATDSFHNTELESLLRGLGVTELVICGLQSEFCVDTTVRRALALGFPVVLVQDAHSTMDNGILQADQIARHHTRTLTSIGSFGVRAKAASASEVSFER